MLICPNCHAHLEDGSLFCDSCGTRIEPPASETSETSTPPQTATTYIYCSHCGQQTDADSPFCPNCGASMNVQEQPATSGEASENKSKKWGVFAGIGAAVIAVIVIVFLFLGKSSGSSSNYALYIKDRQIFYNGFSKQDPQQISSRLLDKDLDISNVNLYEFSRMCRFSKDGSLLFFPDKLDNYSSYSLYYRKIDKPKEEAVKIDSSVASYSVSDDASFITYLKNNALYQYNRKKDDKQKIASDILTYRVSDDGATILYLNEDNILYHTEKGGDRVKIDSDVSNLCYVSDDLSLIFYIKDGTLYKKQNGGDKEKISSDTEAVVKAYDSGEVYYVKAEEEELSLSDFVRDDKKEEDAALKEPEYPNVSWGDPSRDAKINAYERAREEYSLKRQRDYLREALKEQIIPQTSYILCYHDGKKESTVSESFIFSSYSVASDAPVITYMAYTRSDDIRIKLSEIENVYDVQNQVMNALYSTAERYVAAGNVSAVFDEEDTQNFYLSADGKTLYYLADVPEEKNYGELYQVSISSSGELGDPDLYDSDVCTDYFRFSGDGKLLYFKDYKDSKGELYADGKRIDYDVYSNNIQYDEDTGRITYFIDWNYEKRYGTLKTYAGKEPEKIADDTHSYYVMPNGNVLYLYDYSLKHYQGDLYLWNKKEAEKIDDGVVGIIPIY